MIIVIADDITGAAELAGIGLRYGLYVLVAADVVPAKDTELLVVYTNTRSMPEPEAVAVMAAMTEKAKALHPELMYKKTDSILRGHVLAELQAQMNVLGVKKALLVPVNPSLGRTITGGQYFVNGVPVHLAGFANDPEFPIQHSTIREMLRADDSLVKLAANPAALIEDGITVGEAQTTDDVAAWAAVSETDVLFCGGASFFDALLRTRYRHREQKQQQTPSLRKPLLFVSGTTFRKNRERIKALSHLACFMPDAV
ncbi:MAG TPA: four-carbon acid sugar kinase family protein, partial [Flavisolibacter sp.]|nr:four-carbon acid sugar kinase family protein [Flavisolibacter sp.]